MPESINLKLKLDTSDIQGLIGRGGGGGIGVGGVIGGVAGGMAVFHGIKTGIDKLVAASPQLQGTILLFQKSIELMMRPIGDVISAYLRPLVIKLLQFITKSPEAAKALGATLLIGGVSVAGGVGIAAIAKLLGVGTIAGAAGAGGTVGAASIALPATLAIGTVLLGGVLASLIGGGGLRDVMIGMIATAVGLGVVLAAGGGFALAIPVALTLAVVSGFGGKFQRNLRERFGLDPNIDIIGGLIRKLFGKDIPEATEESGDAFDEFRDTALEDMNEIMTGAEALDKALRDIKDKTIIVNVETVYTSRGSPSGAAGKVGLGLYKDVPKPRIAREDPDGWGALYDAAISAKPGETAGDIYKKFKERG